MIAERLNPSKIVFGLRGTLAAATDDLCRRSSTADLGSHFRLQKPDESERYSYLGEGIAVPHVRIEHLAAPELILGLSPEGLSFNNHSVHLVLLLATPAEQPAEHLQLLQRLGSLLPAIGAELLRQRDPRRALQIIAQAELRSALPTYVNLSQEQIGFELKSDLANGLTSAEAEQRLRHYGPNVLQRSRAEPWQFKLVRNLFSFFAMLLWMAALLCFIPGVDLPQLGIAILTVIVVNVAPPLYASAIVVGGALVATGSAAAYGSETVTYGRAARALQKSNLPAVLSEALQTRSLVDQGPDAAGRAVIAVPAWGLIGQSRANHCLVAAVEFTITFPNRPAITEQIRLTLDPTEGVPPVQCASLSRFNEDDGRLIRETIRDYAELLAELVTDRLERLE